MDEIKAKEILKNDPGDLMSGRQHREYGQAEGFLEGLSQERSRSRELEKTVGFFASVIKSGERWTQSCQDEYDKAFAAHQMESHKDEKND